MDRLQKKCLIASSGMHLFLLLVLVMGSAFFVEREKKKIVEVPRIHVVPGILIDKMMAGGGGDPKVAPSDDIQKGQTLAPQPAPAPSKPPAPKPQPPKEVKVTPKPIKPTPPKPPKDETREAVKPNPNARTAIEPLALKPVVRPEAQKRAEEAEAAQKAAEKAARDWAEANGKLVKEVGRSVQGLQTGFAHGTKVRVGGPGGIAYANYASMVMAIFDDAWDVPPDVASDDSIAVAKVIVASDGRILVKQITDRSGNSVLDRSVQRALDRVRSLPHFPESAKDSERTFTIEFNLKAKRLLGLG